MNVEDEQETRSADGLERIRQQVERSREARERLRSLTGHAESDDHRVRVTCTRDDPLRELVIEPSAMHGTARRLAETIQEVAAAARADLRERSRAAQREAADDDAGPVPGLNQARAELRELSQAAGSSAQQASEMFEQVRRHLGL